MTGAFAYLIWTSTRNRLLSQLRKLRNPRYAAAFVVGIVYFWFFFFRRSVQGTGPMSPLLGHTSEILAPLLVVLTVSWTWLFGTSLSALAFSEAEVSMLFPAPVSRRGLVAYKLARAQSAILISSLIYVVLLRRGGTTLDGLLRALALWTFFSMLSLHRLGVALIRAATLDRRSAVARRNWAPILLFGAIVVTIVGALGRARSRFAAAVDAPALLRTVVDVLSTPPASIALYPFHAALAPVFSQAPAAWAIAMLPALALLALHTWWVLSANVAFEEAAAEASTAQAKRLEAFRARRGNRAAPKPKSAARSIPLGTTGRPEVAIAWKNALWMMRTGHVRGLVLPSAIALLCAFGFAGRAGPAETIVAGVSTVLAVILLVTGPLSMRNDLRGDMLHLSMLKTLPLRGSQIVLAEIGSSAAPMAASQYFLLVAAILALSFATGVSPVPVAARFGILAGAPFALLALNAAMFTILNGTAVLFPAWVKLSTAGEGGFEATGQSVLTTAGTVLVLVLLLVIPGIVGLLAFAALRPSLGPAIAVAGTLGGLALLVETSLMIRGLGRAFERAEP